VDLHRKLYFECCLIRLEHELPAQRCYNDYSPTACFGIRQCLLQVLQIDCGFVIHSPNVPNQPNSSHCTSVERQCSVLSVGRCTVTTATKCNYVFRRTALRIHLADVPLVFGSGWLSVRSGVLGGGGEVKVLLYPLFTDLLKSAVFGRFPDFVHLSFC